MRQIEAIALCRVGAGSRVRLSADQAKTRRHNLKEIEPGLYEAMAVLEFKRGESFGYDGPIDRVMEQAIKPLVQEPVEAPKPEVGDPVIETLTPAVVAKPYARRNRR